MVFMEPKTIRLEGKSLKGKNRIREWGEWWIVRPRPAQTQAPADQILLESINERGGHRDTRWIHPTKDPHFAIISGQASLDND
jgi:hypothetical protein